MKVGLELLLTMHNLCIVHEGDAKTADEIARFARIEVQKIRSVLKELTDDGYICRFVDSSGQEKFYVTGLGIIKVCSLYT